MITKTEHQPAYTTLSFARQDKLQQVLKALAAAGVVTDTSERPEKPELPTSVNPAST